MLTGWERADRIATRLLAWKRSAKRWRSVLFMAVDHIMNITRDLEEARATIAALQEELSVTREVARRMHERGENL